MSRPHSSGPHVGEPREESWTSVKAAAIASLRRAVAGAAARPANPVRLTPVLMTALSAGFALLPPMLGADAAGKEILHPAATTSFGILVSATLLDTLLTPVLFLHLDRKPLKRLTRPDADGILPAEAL